MKAPQRNAAVMLACLALVGAAAPDDRPRSYRAFETLRNSGRFEATAAECPNQRMIATQTPIYPHEAWVKKLGGRLLMSVLINPDGTVAASWPIEAEPKGIFERMAMSAVNLWRFDPCMVNGNAVGVQTSVRIVFDPSKQLP